MSPNYTPPSPPFCMLPNAEPPTTLINELRLFLIPGSTLLRRCSDFLFFLDRRVQRFTTNKCSAQEFLDDIPVGCEFQWGCKRSIWEAELSACLEHAHILGEKRNISPSNEGKWRIEGYYHPLKRLFNFGWTCLIFLHCSLFNWSLSGVNQTPNTCLNQIWLYSCK